MRRAAGAALLLAVAAIAASAVTRGGHDASGEGSVDAAAAASAVDPAAQRAALRRALALVGPRDHMGYAILLAAPRAGFRAQIDGEKRTITVFLDPADAPHRAAHDIAHELGHAWDRANLDDTARERYLRARGRPDAPWWPEAADDYATGSGDFAEVFARCHAASPEFRSRLAAAPADACAALPPAARDLP
jgi:hypothetical protein